VLTLQTLSFTAALAALALITGREFLAKEEDIGANGEGI